MRKLQIVSVSHQFVLPEDRISMNLHSDQWDELFAYVRFELNAEGVVKLATCNRLELYVEADTDIRQLIVNKWIELAGINQDFNRNSIKTFYGSALSLRYLLQLSVGLKSAILGDDQILHQLKKAFEEGRKAGELSTLLERAYQAIMRFHKQVCRDTPYKEQTTSLAYQALKAAKYHFGEGGLSAKSCLILGAGDMAKQVLKYIDKFHFGEVALSNRSEENARLLTQEADVVGVVGYDTLKDKSYDVVISCTDFGFSKLQELQTPRFYIDLSIASAQWEDINCDHILLARLQHKIDAQNARRMSCLALVKKILHQHEEEFTTWVSAWEVRRAEAESLQLA